MYDVAVRVEAASAKAGAGEGTSCDADHASIFGSRKCGIQVGLVVSWYLCLCRRFTFFDGNCVFSCFLLQLTRIVTKSSTIGEVFAHFEGEAPPITTDVLIRWRNVPWLRWEIAYCGFKEFDPVADGDWLYAKWLEFAKGQDFKLSLRGI